MSWKAYYYCYHYYYYYYYYYYRTAFNVGRPLIRVVTPQNIADDLLRNSMIKTLIDYL